MSACGSDEANETASHESTDGDGKRNTVVLTSTTYCCDNEDSGLEGTLDGAASLLDDGSKELINDDAHMTTVKFSTKGGTEGERVQLEYTPDHQVVTVLASAADEPFTKRHFLGTLCSVYRRQCLSTRSLLCYLP